MPAFAHIGHGTEGPIVHHDQATVHPSRNWLQALLIRDRARVSYAHAGNPWIESLWGDFRVENGSLLSGAGTPSEAWVGDRAADAVLKRRHSGVGCVPPTECLTGEGPHPRVSIETGPQSGSAQGRRSRVLASRTLSRHAASSSGVQVPHPTSSIL